MFVELYQSMKLNLTQLRFVRKFPPFSTCRTFSSILIGYLKLVWLLSQLTQRRRSSVAHR